LYRTAVSTGWRPNQLPHHDRVLAAGHELTDDGRAGNLTGDQQPTGCLGIGEQECLVSSTADRSTCGATQSRLRRVPPLM
jgi:hypothetical protein